MSPQGKAKMLQNFGQFATRISEEYNRVYLELEKGNYEEAHRILAALTTSHARTSLSLRNLLIKEGLMDE